MFQTNTLFKTNKCHHGGPLGAEGPGQLPPLPPPLNPALSIACCGYLTSNQKVLIYTTHIKSNRQSLFLYSEKKITDKQ